MDSEAAISMLNSRRNERNLDTKLQPNSLEYAFCSTFAAISKSLSDRFSRHLENRIVNCLEVSSKSTLKLKDCSVHYWVNNVCLN